MNLLKSIFVLGFLIVFGFLCLCAVIGLVDYFNKPEEVKERERKEETLEEFFKNFPEQTNDTATFKVDSLKK